jgi:hypothetical protein
MATDLTVTLEDRPGTLAEVGEALGGAGINVDGICGFPCEGKGRLHVLVDGADRARAALEDAGLQVSAERDVLVLDIDDRPGAFGEALRRFADAGVNVDLTYLATSTRLVIGPDDLEKARAAL